MNVKLYSRDLETFQFQEYINRSLGLPPRSYAVDLQNRRYKCRKFQSLRYPCADVHATCARANLDLEQFIDDFCTMQRTFRIWGN